MNTAQTANTGNNATPALPQLVAETAITAREITPQTHPVIYLSGPMTGQPGHGYRAFNIAAANLAMRGFATLNPATNFGGETHYPRALYMRTDITHLLLASAVCVLPKWSQSKGALLEVAIAQELGIPIVWASSLQPVITPVIVMPVSV